MFSSYIHQILFMIFFIFKQCIFFSLEDLFFFFLLGFFSLVYLVCFELIARLPVFFNTFIQF